MLDRGKYLDLEIYIKIVIKMIILKFRGVAENSNVIVINGSDL